MAKVTKAVRAREIWLKFIDAAWASAEPGALFWDTVINSSIADCYADVGYETESVNPCAELPLSVYDSCRLMVVNLISFIKNHFLNNSEFDFKVKIILSESPYNSNFRATRAKFNLSKASAWEEYLSNSSE